MPNQDPTQKQNSNPVNQTAAPPVPPVIFPQSDLPPLPPEFSAIGGSGSAEQKVPSVDTPGFPIDQPVSQPIGNDAGSSAPPDISSVIPKAKKKFGGGKIIATILGLIVLVGGIGAGLILTKQQQIFQPKAVDCGTVNCVSPNGVCCNTGCFPNGTICAPDNTPIGNSTPPSGENDCTGSTPFFCSCGVSGCDNFCFSGVPTGGCNTACDQRCGGHSTGAACPVPPVSCYFCTEGTDVSNGCGTSNGSSTLPAGVSYNYQNSYTCSIGGSFCGWVQCDGYDSGGIANFKSRYDTSCSSTPPTETPTPTAPPTATPTAPPTFSCVDLTNSPTASLNQTVTFTCQANFSSISPVAYFAQKIGTGSFVFDPTAYPINATTKTASKQIIINQVGDWDVQCRVCTDNTATTCTTWGLAN